MKKFFLTVIFFFSLLSPVHADFFDLVQKQDPAMKQTELSTNLHFCKEGESEKDCYQRFDMIFHNALDKNRQMFGECITRVARTFPESLIKKYSTTTFPLQNGKNLSLYEMLQILASENSTKTSACILALTHAISDDMARAFGVPAPVVNHLERFDKREKEVRDEQMKTLQNSPIPPTTNK